jgi:molecular chaperone DnaK (HSP70)
MKMEIGTVMAPDLRTQKEYTVVGIDFGTSTTVVKMTNYGDRMDPENYHSLQFNRSNCLPTLIFEADEDGRLYFGCDAAAQVSGGFKGRLYENFKIDLINEDLDKAVKAKKLTEEFFKYLHEEFIRSRPLRVCPDVRTYISFPAKWPPEERRFLKECAVNAGFENVSGVDEPTAAIYASIVECREELQKQKIIVRNEPVNVLMLDMGAGTSDIAVFKFQLGAGDIPVFGEKITWPTLGNYNCGGREIDELLKKEIYDYVAKISNGRVSNLISKTIRRGGDVKTWKEQNLSETLKERKTVTILPSRVHELIREKQVEGVYRNTPFELIDRERFERITNSHWKQLRSLIDESMREAAKTLDGFNGAEDIDLVILTGGHSQWYRVDDIITGENIAGCEPMNFSKIKQNQARLLQAKNPQESVAIGLVYKDMGFDLKRTMGNSMWIQYEFCEHKSEPIQLAEYDDVLPIQNLTHNYEFSIQRSIFETKELPFICHCRYGINFESAVYHKTEKKVRLKEIFKLVLDWLIPIVNVFTALDAIFGSQDKYKMKVSTTVNVSEDGAVEIEVTLAFKKEYSSEWKAVEPVKIKL